MADVLLLCISGMRVELWISLNVCPYFVSFVYQVLQKKKKNFFDALHFSL